MNALLRLMFTLTGLLSPFSLLAEEFAIVGPRAMGMGGAGVAVTRGALSTYWNPAALAPPRAPEVDTLFDISLPGSASWAATEDTLRDLDEVTELVDDIDFGSLTGGGPASTDDIRGVLRLFEALPDLNGNGLIANAGAGVNLRFSRFGLSALGIFRAGGVTLLDTNALALGTGGIGAIIGGGMGNSPATAAGQALADSLAADGLATQAQAEEIVFQAEQAGVNVADPGFQGLLRDTLQATLDNTGGSPANNITENQSGVDLRGVLLQEYSLGYSQPLFGIVSVGVAGKFLHATTYYTPFRLNDLDGFDDFFDEATDDEFKEESVNFGVDVGVLVQPLDWLSLGILGRNLNRPKFDFAAPEGDYVLDQQVRAGVGVHLSSVILALDLDLLKNESKVLPGRDSQMIGAGAEWSVWDTLFVRAGLSKNLAESDEDVGIHAGLGLRLFRVQIDIAAHAVPDLTEINSSGDEIPERGGASIMIAVNVPLD